VDLYDAASYHQLALNAAGKSPETSKLYLIYERRFLEYLESRSIPTALESLNPLHARQAVLWFQQRRIGKRGGASATAMFLNVLKTWASFLEQEGVWADSPLRRVHRVKVRKLERQPYTRAECHAMLHACTASASPARDLLLVNLLLGSGARIGELTGLHVADMRWDTRTIRVLGKGNRERTVPIGEPDQPDGGPIWRAWRTYLKWRAERVALTPGRANDQLFLSHAGYPLTADGATDIVKRLGDAAGVEGAIPHRFRHTFCTVYLTKFPGDELGLRRIVGHLSKAVLADYTHIAQTEIAARAGHGSPTSTWLKEGTR
jgi:integrase/recombinase XerD